MLIAFWFILPNLQLIIIVYTRDHRIVPWGQVSEWGAREQVVELRISN